MAAAFSARFRDELPPLTADLPPAGTAAPAAGAPGAWRGVFAALVVLPAGGLALAGHVFFDGGHAAHLAERDGR